VFSGLEHGHPNQDNGQACHLGGLQPKDVQAVPAPEFKDEPANGIKDTVCQKDRTFRRSSPAVNKKNA